MDSNVISVIVPIYKTERFLRGCLDSVIGQTHQALQIILVDDGSPDGCGAICEEYARRDSRVTVIHQENKGLSGAWNAGLDAAVGDWIGFVDSDDWVEPDAFAYLLENALASGADIAVCGVFDEYRSRTGVRSPGSRRLLSPGEMLYEMEKNPGIQSYTWNKLWRRELYEGMRYPGKTSGDIALSHLLIERAINGILLLPEAKCHYRMLPESISGDKKLARCFNFLDVFRKRRDDLYERWPELRPDLDALCVQASIRAWCGCYANPKAERESYAPRFREAAAFSRAHYRDARRRVDAGVTGRAAMFLTQFDRPWAFALAFFFGWLYSLKHERAL